MGSKRAKTLVISIEQIRFASATPRVPQPIHVTFSIVSYSPNDTVTDWSSAETVWTFIPDSTPRGPPVLHESDLPAFRPDPAHTPFSLALPAHIDAMRQQKELYLHVRLATGSGQKILEAKFLLTTEGRFLPAAFEVADSTVAGSALAVSWDFASVHERSVVDPDMSMAALRLLLEKTLREAEVEWRMETMRRLEVGISNFSARSQRWL